MKIYEEFYQNAQPQSWRLPSAAGGGRPRPRRRRTRPWASAAPAQPAWRAARSPAALTLPAWGSRRLLAVRRHLARWGGLARGGAGCASPRESGPPAGGRRRASASGQTASERGEGDGWDSYRARPSLGRLRAKTDAPSRQRTPRSAEREPPLSEASTSATACSNRPKEKIGGEGTPFVVALHCFCDLRCRGDNQRTGRSGSQSRHSKR